MSWSSNLKGNLDNLVKAIRGEFNKIITKVNGLNKDVKNKADKDGSNINKEDWQRILGFVSDSVLEEIKSKVVGLESLDFKFNSSTNMFQVLKGENSEVIKEFSLEALGNQGTDLRYNNETKSLELYNAKGEKLDSIPISDFIKGVPTNISIAENKIKISDREGTEISSVGLDVSSVSGLQGELDKMITLEGSKLKYRGATRDETEVQHLTIPKITIEQISQLTPRLSTDEIAGLIRSGLEVGSLIYNTSTGLYQYYNGDVWVNVSNLSLSDVVINNSRKIEMNSDFSINTNQRDFKISGLRKEATNDGSKEVLLVDGLGNITKGDSKVTNLNVNYPETVEFRYPNQGYTDISVMRSRANIMDRLHEYTSKLKSLKITDWDTYSRDPEKYKVFPDGKYCNEILETTNLTTIGDIYCGAITKKKFTIDKDWIVKVNISANQAGNNVARTVFGFVNTDENLFHTYSASIGQLCYGNYNYNAGTFGGINSSRHGLQDIIFVHEGGSRQLQVVTGYADGYVDFKVLSLIHDEYKFKVTTHYGDRKNGVNYNFYFPTQIYIGEESVVTTLKNMKEVLESIEGRAILSSLSDFKLSEITNYGYYGFNEGEKRLTILKVPANSDPVVWNILVSDIDFPLNKDWIITIKGTKIGKDSTHFSFGFIDKNNLSNRIHIDLEAIYPRVTTGSGVSFYIGENGLTLPVWDKSTACDFTLCKSGKSLIVKIVKLSTMEEFFITYQLDHFYKSMEVFKFAVALKEPRWIKASEITSYMADSWNYNSFRYKILD